MTSTTLSKKQLNFARFSILCVDIITLPLKDILDIFVKPADLDKKIKACPPLLTGIYKLNPDEKKKCCYNSSNTPDYSTFDITLLYKLIRYLCPSLEPPNKWGTKPTVNDLSIGDDIERIRELRNKRFAHPKCGKISDDDFMELWSDAKHIIQRCQHFTTSRGCNTDYNQMIVDLQKRTLTFDEYISIVECYGAIYISGDTEVPCGNTARFEAEISTEQDVYMPLNWDRVDGLVREQINIENKKYEGSDTRNLIINNVCMKDKGGYQAVISRKHDVKILSNMVYLRPQGELPCLEELNATTKNGEICIHYMFKVSESSPFTEIKWTKNNSELKVPSDKYRNGEIEDNFITIVRPSEGDKGLYTCTIWNAVEPVSKSIRLDIPSAEIVSTSNSKVVCGSDTTFDCTVSGYPSPDEVKWQHSPDGKEFVDIDTDTDKYLRSRSDLCSHSLLVRKATLNQQRYYRVAVSNGIGKCTSNKLFLQVTGSKPNISEVTCSLHGNSVKLKCDVFLYDESPPLNNVYWTKGDKHIVIASNDGKYAGADKNDPSLTIYNVNCDDAGDYKLIAVNPVGETWSKVILLGVPEILLKECVKKEDGSLQFTMTIKSVPVPHSVKWNIKENNTDTFEPINVNAAEYIGTSNTFPHPVLVLKHLEKLDYCIFEIEVKNRIGEVKRVISGDIFQEELKREKKTLGTFYAEGGSGIPFSIWLSELAEKFPKEKMDTLKFLIQLSCKIEDVTELEKAKTAQDCFKVLLKEKIISPSDVVSMQFLLIRTKCEELEKECIDYAKQQKAMHFYEKPPENGYRNVRFHVVRYLQQFSTEDETKIRETVSRIVGCSIEDVGVNGYLYSSSFFLVLSIKEIYTERLFDMKQHDKEQLSSLSIDYFKDDFKTVQLEHTAEVKDKDKVMIDPSKSITKSSKEYCIGDKGQDKLKQAGKFNIDSGSRHLFAKLIDGLAAKFPTKEIPELKHLIKSSVILNDNTELQKASSAAECFSILQKEDVFTPSDVMAMQFLLQETKCKELEKECIEYAEKRKAKYFYEKSPENGYRNVRLHVVDNVFYFKVEDETKIRETVANIVGCSTEDIRVNGYRLANSFFLVLSIREIYIGRLFTIQQHDKDRLLKLKIDFFKDDLNTMRVGYITDEQKTSTPPSGLSSPQEVKVNKYHLGGRSDWLIHDTKGSTPSSDALCWHSSSDFKSNLEIKNIHFNLIDELIVSHIEDDRQSVAAWNVAFRRIVNIPTRTNYSVRDDFNYLERRGLLGVGRYEVLKELFGKKKETLSAIQQASKKIGDILESIRMDRHLLGMETYKEWTLPVTSPELRRLFESFQINVTEDPRQSSFTKCLLMAIQCQKIVESINLLSSGANLQMHFFSTLEETRPGSMYVFEVEVICAKGKLVVIEKDLKNKVAFFHPASKNMLRVIWIYSKSVNVVDAKLAVFINYESYLKTDTIFLQHVFDNAENVIKFGAYQQVKSLEKILDSCSESVPIDGLRIILQAAIDKVLSKDSMREFCFEIFLRDNDVNVGTAACTSYSCGSMKIVRQIQEQLVDLALKEAAKTLGLEICRGILKQIESKTNTKLEGYCSHLKFVFVDDYFATNTVAIVNDVLSQLFRFIISLGTLNMTYALSVDVNSKDWRGKVADEISNTIYKNKTDILIQIGLDVKLMCLQTVQELIAVSKTIADFQHNIGYIDQKSLITEWKKRDELHQFKEIFESNPSILTFLAGTRNGLPVVKVFLTGDDKKDVEIQLREKYPAVPFEFVDIDTESENILKNMEKVEKREQSAPEIDKETRKLMNEVVKRHAEKILANHSGVIGIEISNVRLDNNEEKNEQCIVLLCLDEFILPFGESPLPKSIEDYPCDVRTEFVTFGHCAGCRTLNIGCSIGIPSVDSAGSVGFFVRSNDSQGFSKSGFLTAAHVAIEHYSELYENNLLLSRHSLAKKSHKITHPSYADNNVNCIIGEVVESYFGNWTNGTGIDAAFVSTNQQKLREVLHLADENSLVFNGSMLVKKRGRTTGDTVGILVGDCLYVRVYSTQVHRRYYEFDNCFAVRQKEKGTPFFDKGDSGSGVFLIDEKESSLKPLGIAFASFRSKTAVCKIGQITDAFNVSVYEDEELMDTS